MPGKPQFVTVTKEENTTEYDIIEDENRSRDNQNRPFGRCKIMNSMKASDIHSRISKKVSNVIAKFSPTHTKYRAKKQHVPFSDDIKWHQTNHRPHNLPKGPVSKTNDIDQSEPHSSLANGSSLCGELCTCSSCPEVNSNLSHQHQNRVSYTDSLQASPFDYTEHTRDDHSHKGIHSPNSCSCSDYTRWSRSDLESPLESAAQCRIDTPSNTDFYENYQHPRSATPYNKHSKYDQVVDGPVDRHPSNKEYNHKSALKNQRHQDNIVNHVNLRPNVNPPSKYAISQKTERDNHLCPNSCSRAPLFNNKPPNHLCPNSCSNPLIDSCCCKRAPFINIKPIPKRIIARQVQVQLPNTCSMQNLLNFGSVENTAAPTDSPVQLSYHFDDVDPRDELQVLSTKDKKKKKKKKRRTTTYPTTQTTTTEKTTIPTTITTTNTPSTQKTTIPTTITTTNTPSTCPPCPTCAPCSCISSPHGKCRLWYDIIALDQPDTCIPNPNPFECPTELSNREIPASPSPGVSNLGHRTANNDPTTALPTVASFSGLSDPTYGPPPTGTLLENDPATGFPTTGTLSGNNTTTIGFPTTSISSATSNPTTGFPNSVNLTESGYTTTALPTTKTNTTPAPTKPNPREDPSKKPTQEEPKRKRRKIRDMSNSRHSIYPIKMVQNPFPEHPGITQFPQLHTAFDSDSSSSESSASITSDHSETPSQFEKQDFSPSKEDKNIELGQTSPLNAHQYPGSSLLTNNEPLARGKNTRHPIIVGKKGSRERRRGGFYPRHYARIRRRERRMRRRRHEEGRGGFLNWLKLKLNWKKEDLYSVSHSNSTVRDFSKSCVTSTKKELPQSELIISSLERSSDRSTLTRPISPREEPHKYASFPENSTSILILSEHESEYHEDQAKSDDINGLTAGTSTSELGEYLDAKEAATPRRNDKKPVAAAPLNKLKMLAKPNRAQFFRHEFIRRKQRTTSGSATGKDSWWRNFNSKLLDAV